MLCTPDRSPRSAVPPAPAGVQHHFSREKRGQAVNSPSEIRQQWGHSDFQAAVQAQIEPLPLTASDKTLLATIGLPVSPKEALTLQLRFESIVIRHQPHGVRLLRDTDIEKGPLYLCTGSSRPNLDS